MSENVAKQAADTSRVLREQEKLTAPPKERVEFKKLLAANPNYFGNLVESAFKPVKKIAGNNTYEDLSCLGFNPALNLLEATVLIKLPSGYQGGLCFAGSTEFVRFYIDYGAGWEDLGLSAFNAHDIPNLLDCAKKKDKPLSYVVTMPLDPRQKTCKTPVLPRVRAILSWQAAPPANQPNWVPVWGDVIDRHIQIRPRKPFFKDVIDLLSKEQLLKLPPEVLEVEPIPIPFPDPSPLGLAQLAGLYAKSKAASSDAAAVMAVEPHRFGFEQLQVALEQGSQETLFALAQEWQGAKLNLAEALAALDKTKADVTYEELECLGLEYNLERLVATFRVKKPNGFLGGLCTPGSKEYVAFWVDWDDTCQWTYLNTVAVTTHDIAPLPAGGLSYSAVLPVDLSAVRRPCTQPKIARIRAVLSWNVPPSNVDPEALTHWGNRIDAHVQIRPGDPHTGGQPAISIIGGIGIADIDVFGNGMTKAGATFAFGGSPADPWLLNRFCPFGGLVIVQGPPILGFKYRLWARKFGQPLTEEVVKNTFHIVNWLGVGSNITPDPLTGFVTYLDTLSNMNQVLGHWVPPGDELWEIRLEAVPLMGVGGGTTPWYRVQLDNTAPRRRPALAPFEPPAVMCEIHIDSGGDCKDFVVANKITGRFTARDAHFGAFSLSTLPASMVPPNPTTATPSTSQTASFAAGGDLWELDTSTMAPCGYVVLLQIWDRSIVNSHPSSHNYSSFDVGFCLRTKV